MCKHYHWDHDFWRRMGLREFWAWIEQLHSEKDQQHASADSWQAAEHDPNWQSMRAKRDKLRGR